MAIEAVLSTDTPNAGRVKWNNSDTSLQNEITAHKSGSDHDGRYYTEAEIDSQQATQDSALTTHKSSSDHDGRYYTEAEVDAKIKRQPFMLQFAWKTGDAKFYANNIEVNDSMGVPIDRTGCLMKLLRVKGDGSIVAATGTYDVASDRYFTGQRRLSMKFEASGTILVPTVDGSSISSLAISTSDNNDIQILLYGEYA